MGSPRPGQPAPFGAPPANGGFGVPAPQSQGPNFTDVDCALEALPRMGNIDGSVKDANGASVANASVTVTDSLGKEYKATSDASGKFKVEGLPPARSRCAPRRPAS